jgi:hypothetical protein
MPLITRTLKGSKLSIEEMDGNLTYLEGLATSQLRDYVQLQNKPLVIDNLDRWNTTKEVKFNSHHLYIDGPYTIRFTNHVNEGGPNYLFRAWDWDGPSSAPATPYQNEEVVYNERAQISFIMEDLEKSSLSFKSFDWTSGTQSGVEFDYKFYQGGVILPYNTIEPVDNDGCIAFSDGVNWNPNNLGQPTLNVRIGGEWKQVNFGPGVTGPSGPAGNDGPQGSTGPSYIINNFGQNKFVLSDGTENGLIGQDDLTYDGLTFSILGDVKIFGSLDQPIIKSPSIDTPTLNYAILQGDTTLQNITTVLVDSILVTNATVNFDFNLGSVFYVSSPSNDFTLNIINLPLVDSRAINITVFVDQGITNFTIIGFEIDGVPKVIRWIGGTPPTTLPTTVTAFTFNILRSNNDWVQVLGAAGIYA